MAREKIYTRAGDDGTTGLFYGGRVGKDSALPRAYGAVDEAQAILGLVRAEAGTWTEETFSSPEYAADWIKANSVLVRSGSSRNMLTKPRHLQIGRAHV